eukprot:Gb_13190 [translate_table: standard]
MAQPKRNAKQNILLVFALTLQLQCRKIGIRTTTSATATTALNREGNGHNSFSEDVRRLSKQGRLKEALHILNTMDQSVDSYTYVCFLQGCIKKKALSEGRQVHTHMTDKGFKPDSSLQNTLVNMYAKCGSLVDARGVFDQMPKRDVFSWTTMIAAYTRHGLADEALTLFYQMQRAGIQPNRFTYASVIPSCAKLAALDQGMEIHHEINTSGFQSDIFLGNALLDMYTKCGSLENARNVFDKMPQRDALSWTVMIAAYARHRYAAEALLLFDEMQRAGIQPDSFTFASVLPACADLAALEKGMEIHEEIIRYGFQSDVFVGNALVDMYAKCGSIEKARDLFDNMKQRDVVTWTAMISGYAQNGQDGEALKLFRQMQLAGVKANLKTFASVLPACANLAALGQGMELHKEIIRSGSQPDVFVESALVDMYSKCGSIEEASILFGKMSQRNAVSWTSMIVGYEQNGQVDEALKIFQKMPQRDVVSWNAMIAGYTRNGQGEEALEFFRQMQLAGMKPDCKTLASVLPACANLAALEQGKEIHVEITRRGFQSNIFVANALIDMYAKCGSIENARDVFDKIQKRDVVSWNAMITGYAMHGYGKEALKLFQAMQHSGMNPDHVTLVCVLSACCHAGLVDEGQQYFDCMSQIYHITPAMEHYSIMVDLLGRAGRLDEAQDFINKMPIKPDATVWGCLLGACRIHKNIGLGERVAECLFELNPKDASPYVLLSNIYAAAGRWDGIEKVRKMMKDRRVRKMPGCSWIEVNKQVHPFLVGDRSHPQTQKIYAKLDTLSMQMKAAGYAPDMRFALNDVEEEQKEQILCQHSEKLAIVFGLINTSPGTAIRVIKNLRVCGDCHSAIKFMSKIVAREIVVRDAHRYHHFKDGWCSCGDYW